MSEQGGKDWRTVKLPKDVRDDASDDPRTYAEIMQAGLALSIDPKTLERFNDAKSEHASEQSADVFVNRLLDTRKKVIEQEYGGTRDDGAPEVSDDSFSPVHGVDGEELQEQLDRIESSASTVEERTGSIEKELEALQQ